MARGSPAPSLMVDCMQLTWMWRVATDEATGVQFDTLTLSQGGNGLKAVGSVVAVNISYPEPFMLHVKESAEQKKPSVFSTGYNVCASRTS